MLPMACPGASGISGMDTRSIRAASFHVERSFRVPIRRNPPGRLRPPIPALPRDKKRLWTTRIAQVPGGAIVWNSEATMRTAVFSPDVLEGARSVEGLCGRVRRGGIG